MLLKTVVAGRSSVLCKFEAAGNTKLPVLGGGAAGGVAVQFDALFQEPSTKPVQVNVGVAIFEEKPLVFLFFFKWQHFSETKLNPFIRDDKSSLVDSKRTLLLVIY